MFENLTRAEYEVLLRHDLATFAGRCFQDLNPQTCLAVNWHLEVIAAKLTAVREGRIRRLIINTPYLFDFTWLIFHPTRRRQSIGLCGRQQGGMSQWRPVLQRSAPERSSWRRVDAAWSGQNPPNRVAGLPRDISGGCCHLDRLHSYRLLSWSQKLARSL